MRYFREFEPTTREEVMDALFAIKAGGGENGKLAEQALGDIVDAIEGGYGDEFSVWENYDYGEAVPAMIAFEEGIE